MIIVDLVVCIGLIVQIIRSIAHTGDYIFVGIGATARQGVGVGNAV